MGAIMASQLTTPPTPASFMDGFERALLVGVRRSRFVGAIVAALLVRPHDRSHGGRGAARPAEAA